MQRYCTIQIYYEDDETIKEINIPKKLKLNELKNEIKKHFPGLSNNFQIIKNDKELNVSDIELEEEDCLTIRDNGNSEANPVFLPDLADENIEHLPIEDNIGIDRWLIVRPGLNLIGECNNKNCFVYGKMVINSVNNSSSCYNYDHVKNNGLMKCPECDYQIVSKNICFYKCYYNYYGSKVNNSKIENFDEEIPNFEYINDNNTVNINGKTYHIHKTPSNFYDYFRYYDNGEEIMYIKLIFQIKIFQ